MKSDIKKRIKVRTFDGDFMVSCKLPPRGHLRLQRAVAESDFRIAEARKRQQQVWFWTRRDVT
jgi:hypothetical protein